MITPKENHGAYQAALVWGTRPVEAAERQGLTREDQGGWQTFQPDQQALEHAWRALYDIPNVMTHLLPPPRGQWEQVLLRWRRHRHARGSGRV